MPSSLATFFACFQRGDKILVARNCHKAVYHAIEIRGLRPIYVYPEIDEEYGISVGITAKQVEEAIKQHEEYAQSSGLKYSVNEYFDRPRGMILTSPTYEGVTSEIKEIAETVLRKMFFLWDDLRLFLFISSLKSSGLMFCLIF